MKMEQTTKDRIVRNVLLSLFIYMLPVALMFASFVISGERPWEKKPAAQVVHKSLIIKNTAENGSND